MKLQLKIGCGLLIAALALYIYFQLTTHEPIETVDKPSIEEPSDASRQQAIALPAKQPNPYDTPDPNDPRITRLKNGTVLYNTAVDSSRTLDQTIDPNEALVVIDQLISHYRFAYKENPVGSENEEIVAQLLGKNPKRIVFLDPESKALKNKQLLDQWNQPYFFHALSGQEMEIRSAGPDTQLWTKDDVVINQ
ncbi:MAG: hypothetical protein ACSHX8_00635 [Opitutaceae bacterium]